MKFTDIKDLNNAKSDLNDLNQNIHEFKQTSKLKKILKEEITKNKTNNNDTEDKEPQVVVEKTETIVENRKGGNGCTSSLGCFYLLTTLPRFGCCGLILISILFCAFISFLFWNIKDLQILVIKNIVPVFVNNSDVDLPDPAYFSVSTRVDTEINNIRSSTDTFTSLSIYEQEANTWINSNKSLIGLDKSSIYLKFKENSLIIYLRLDEVNSIWTTIIYDNEIKDNQLKIKSIKYGNKSIPDIVVNNFITSQFSDEKIKDTLSKLILGDNTNKKIESINLGSQVLEISIKKII